MSSKAISNDSDSNIIFLENVDIVNDSNLPNGISIQFPIQQSDDMAAIFTKFKEQASKVKEEYEQLSKKQGDWDKIKEEHLQKFYREKKERLEAIENKFSSDLKNLLEKNAKEIQDFEKNKIKDLIEINKSKSVYTNEYKEKRLQEYMKPGVFSTLTRNEAEKKLSDAIKEHEAKIEKDEANLKERELFFHSSLAAKEQQLRENYRISLEVEEKKLEDEKRKLLESLSKEEAAFFGRSAFDWIDVARNAIRTDDRKRLLSGLKQEGLNAAIVALFEDEGLLDAVWSILFGHPFQGKGLKCEIETLGKEWIEKSEDLVEKWCAVFFGIPKIFQGLPEGDNQSLARKVSLLTALSIKLTGKTEEGKEHGFVGNLSSAAIQSAIETFIRELENIAVERKRIVKNEGEEEIVITESRKSLFQAVAKALTGEDEIKGGLIGQVVQSTCEKISESVFGHKLEEEGKSLLERLFGTKIERVREKGVYPYISKDVKSVIKKVDGVVERVENMMAPINKELPKVGELINTVAVTLGAINRTLGISSAEEEAPCASDSEQEEVPGTLPLNSVVDRALSGLQGVVISGGNAIVKKVIPASLNHLLRGIKWGAEKLLTLTEEDKKSLSDDLVKQEQGSGGILIEEDERNLAEALIKDTEEKRKALLKPLLEGIDQVIDSEGAPLEQISALLIHLQVFAKELENKNTWVLVNGIPLFLLKPDADFTATPHYLLAKERQRLKQPKKSENQSASDLTQVKRDSAHYAYLRFIYEGVAGLSPANGGIFNAMFANGKKPEELKQRLFDALERAHANGDCSKARMWIAKSLAAFMEPICKQFLEPFFSNIESKFRSMGKQNMLEEAGALILEELTNYFGSIVQRFLDVGEGDLKKWGTIHTAMLEKVKEDRYYSGNATVQERHRKVIEQAVDTFAPPFTFGTNTLKRLMAMKIDEKSSQEILNILKAIAKILPGVLIFLFLYIPQEIMNFGMKWGLKQIGKRKVQMLDDIVQEVAKTSASDLFIERARLQGIQSVILKMIENIQNPDPAKDKKIRRGPEQDQMSDLVAHMHLATEFGSAKTTSELKRTIKEKENASKDAFSFFGFTLNLKDLLDEETHKRTVEHLVHSYRQALDENFIKDIATSVVEMLNGIFEPKVETPEQLRKEISELKDMNDKLLAEAINLSIEKGIESLLDETGKATAHRLVGLISNIKNTTKAFIKKSQNILRKQEGNVPESLIISALDFHSGMQLLFNEEPNQMRMMLSTFAKTFSSYEAALGNLRNETTDTNHQDVLNALNALKDWEEEVQIPFIVNYSLKMKGIMNLVKARVRAYAESEVRKVENFLKRPYNIAGLTHWLLGMFGDGKLPFQKTH